MKQYSRMASEERYKNISEDEYYHKKALLAEAGLIYFDPSAARTRNLTPNEVAGIAAYIERVETASDDLPIILKTSTELVTQYQEQIVEVADAWLWKYQGQMEHRLVEELHKIVDNPKDRYVKIWGNEITEGVDVLTVLWLLFNNYFAAGLSSSEPVLLWNQWELWAQEVVQQLELPTVYLT